MPNDYTEEIAQIEAILNSGITETVEDGHVTKFDLDHLRRRLHELKVKSGQIPRRNRIRTIRLG